MMWGCVLTLMLWSTVVESQWNYQLPSPPTFIKVPPHTALYQVSHTADEDSHRPFFLECEANGNPEPTYRWTKDGKLFDLVAHDDRISQQPGRGTLVVTIPKDTDEGVYQCFAENSLGTSVSNTVILRKSGMSTWPSRGLAKPRFFSELVTTPPPNINNVPQSLTYDLWCPPELGSFLENGPVEITAHEGKPLTLPCTAPAGFPRPNIFWAIQSISGVMLPINSSRIASDPEGNLHFSNVTQEDALVDAVYVCCASSTFRNQYKRGKKVILRVEAADSTEQASYPITRQYTSSSNIVALRGQPAMLTCIYGGTPLPDIEWTKNGKRLDPGKYKLLNNGRDLKISSVDFEYEGTYVCKASNGVDDPQSKSIDLTVQSAPFWLFSPDDTNAAEGESVKFECKASGVPEPQLQWYINGQPLEQVAPDPRRKVENNVLTLENLEKKDTAVYQCNASNIHDYVFKNFYLNILRLAPIIMEPPDVVTEATVTSSVTLRCRVTGAPRPRVKWTRDGQEITGGRYHVMDSGDLRIEQVMMRDIGLYKCFASNMLGETEAEGALFVKSKTKIIQPPESFEVAAGKSATFRCNAVVDPTLDVIIEWRFNGHPIEFDPRIIKSPDNSLTISKTTELDSGLYTCVATTKVDMDQASATLIVQGRPNPPRIIGVNCDDQIATIEWQSTGDQRAPILIYNIEYSTNFAPDLWLPAFSNIPAPDTNPWANYTFRVIARNKIGESPPSSSSERCTTDIDVPYKNPEHVRGHGTRPDNLVISWTPMPLIEQNGPGFFYKVFWKRDDIPNSNWVQPEVTITDWRQNELVIDNQPTFKPYRIKVEAHNIKGQANVQATEVVGYSGEDLPSEAPSNFRLLEIVDPNSARFSWDPVPPESLNGHFKGYKILTWIEERQDARQMLVSPNVTTALVTILKPNSNNKVVVLAFNEGYNGPDSDMLDVRTPRGTPGPIVQFNAYPLGSNALFLIWKPPVDTNDTLIGYNIYYQEVHGTELGVKMERHPSISDPTVTRAKLDGLKPNTLYRVAVVARNEAGEGTPYFVEETTSRDSPTPPDLTADKVKVTCIAAVNENNQVTVQYREKGEDHWKPMTQDSGLELNSLYEMRVVADV
ncbi:CHL1 [Cordylochernes scorpioides]|uniref:CHL1 n=1 Tax=Cordylochernes scorpioides TaxID=51811 RepID=A0ABY6KG73_9ARAC|nr:CHL1 [Cordylochernes scorpioides]